MQVSVFKIIVEVCILIEMVPAKSSFIVYGHSSSDFISMINNRKAILTMSNEDSQFLKNADKVIVKELLLSPPETTHGSFLLILAFSLSHHPFICIKLQPNS